MKIIYSFIVAMASIATTPSLHADTFDVTTNRLMVPSIQYGLATYTNVYVDLGSDYQVTAVQASEVSNLPISTLDNYDAANNLLTIPLVSVGSKMYQNVQVKLGRTFQVISVGGCSGVGCGAATPDNVAPLIVDNGPISLLLPGQLVGSTNVAFTTVTLCQPGTNNCQNIDHVLVDTGSSGFRVISSQLAPNLNLPVVMNAGSTVFECLQYVSSFNWGSVNRADIKIAGELASNIPIQIINASSNINIPRSCSRNGGVATNTVDSFGANGILGIGNLPYDCGAVCTTSPPIPAAYYSCSGNTCQSISLPLAQQVPNPIARFSKDNNGSIIQLPAVPVAGASNVQGVLIFGIGTQSNNGLGSAKVITLDTNTLDANYNAFTTIYNGQALTGSFVDSGSSAYYFYDSLLGLCPRSGYACPNSTLSMTATNQGLSTSSTVSFDVANADMLFNNYNATAFSNLAVPSAPGSSFDWGLPFFYGRSVYTGIQTTTSSPYVAY